MNRKEIEVHAFDLSDCEDPEIYAAQPLWEWQQTDHGQWVLDNALEKPVFYIRPGQWEYRVVVTAKLSEENELFYKLKYAK